ncbi:unnamed protein product [Brassica napus]|uniref:(rape) hypothetical protein n=1 Tax=Brassica napus TaxID=3708 RepID=A0A816P150_BRANA|nr:unnamed protein product [Brassica napus]
MGRLSGVMLCLQSPSHVVYWNHFCYDLMNLVTLTSH